MKTNFQNINTFEACTIFMIVVGVALIGAVFYDSLNDSQQSKLNYAVSFLDVHEQAAQESEAVAFIFNVPNEFFNQFNIAFIQTMSFPDNVAQALDTAQEIATSVEKSVQTIADVVGNYSDQVAFDYTAVNKANSDYQGKVLGAFLEVAPTPEVQPIKTEFWQSNEVETPYTFVAQTPDLKKLSQLIFKPR